jgi:hypothetical protein
MDYSYSEKNIANQLINKNIYTFNSLDNLSYWSYIMINISNDIPQILPTLFILDVELNIKLISELNQIYNINIKNNQKNKIILGYDFINTPLFIIIQNKKNIIKIELVTNYYYKIDKLNKTNFDFNKYLEDIIDNLNNHEIISKNINNNLIKIRNNKNYSDINFLFS